MTYIIVGLLLFTGLFMLSVSILRNAHMGEDGSDPRDSNLPDDFNGVE